MSTHCTVQSIEIGSTTPTTTYLVPFLRGGGRAVGMYETIHLRSRQIFTIFNPYPPTIGIPAKCLWRGFLILMYCDLSTIGPWGHPSPPKTCWRLKWMVPYPNSSFRGTHFERYETNFYSEMTTCKVIYVSATFTVNLWHYKWWTCLLWWDWFMQ